jgi:hypothetical protein
MYVVCLCVCLCPLTHPFFFFFCFLWFSLVTLSRCVNVTIPIQLTREAYCEGNVNDLFVAIQPTLNPLPMNVQTLYFGGHHPECDSTRMGSRCLQLAMFNLRNSFAWVGVLEQLELSLKLLRITIPDLFSELDVDSAALTHENQHDTATHLSDLLPEYRELLIKYLRYDMALYENASALLLSRARACGLV